jgi:Zn finger protein HypA/HybF involved in hydrogenase expression
MTNIAQAANGRPHAKEENAQRIVARTKVKCQFCGQYNTVDPQDLTCSNCNTTAPRNYGST